MFENRGEIVQESRALERIQGRGNCFHRILAEDIVLPDEAFDVGVGNGAALSTPPTLVSMLLVATTTWPTESTFRFGPTCPSQFLDFLAGHAHCLRLLVSGSPQISNLLLRLSNSLAIYRVPKPLPIRIA